MTFFNRTLLIAVAVSASAGSQAQAQYTLTTLASFNGTNGFDPEGGLIADASGNLYGTTGQCGAYYTGPGPGETGYGTVFEIAAGTNNAITTLASFNGTNG